MTIPRTAVLPACLKPRPVRESIRLGRDNDGGYVVDRASIEAAQFLLSFGINDDWSFEKDFRKISTCPLVAFDPTISYGRFVKDFIRSLPYLHRPSLMAKRYRPFADYRRFFQGEVKHIQSFVGLDHIDGQVSLGTILDEHVPASCDSVFLKVDIEGGEYRILDEILQHADRLSGLAIEFHDADLHWERIESFVKSIPLAVCHVHCNNYEALTASQLPIALELCFTRYAEAGDFTESLPGPLDMPNKPGVDDIAIEFATSEP